MLVGHWRTSLENWLERGLHYLIPGKYRWPSVRKPRGIWRNLTLMTHWGLSPQQCSWGETAGSEIKIELQRDTEWKERDEEDPSVCVSGGHRMKGKRWGRPKCVCVRGRGDRARKSHKQAVTSVNTEQKQNSQFRKAFLNLTLSRKLISHKNNRGVFEVKSQSFS